MLQKHDKQQYSTQARSHAHHIKRSSTNNHREKNLHSNATTTSNRFRSKQRDSTILNKFHKKRTFMKKGAEEVHQFLNYQSKRRESDFAGRIIWSFGNSDGWKR